jgi:hypothetical protein
MARWILFDVGPTYSDAVSPHEFKRMAELASADTTSAKIAGLGSFLDREYVWRLSASDDQFDRIVKEYGLVTMAPQDVPGSFWQAFPRLWAPSPTVNSSYFATPGFPADARGDDGEHYFAMYDSQNERLYVWCKFNF